MNGLDENCVPRSGDVVVRTVSSHENGSAAATAVAKSADEAQPPRTEKHSATTKSEAVRTASELEHQARDKLEKFVQDCTEALARNEGLPISFFRCP